ncbi:MAG: DUF1349 domain-containing protein [Candidatus Latescibacterota bacterium]
MDLFQGCRGRSLANGLRWLNEPPEWQFGVEGLRIVPAPRTDFFRPADGAAHDSAGLLHTTVNGDFTVRTHVRAELAGFGDAGALTVRAAPDQWAKICVERSPVGEVGIVSVVTDPWSDDANAELLAAPEAFLRITRKGSVFGLHYSLDGDRWRFVRAFTCRMPDGVLVGVHAQAPFQGGCRATFGLLEITPQPVPDFRSGE